MTFLVNLIKSAPTEFLKDNATHVTGHYWLYEGMLECIGGSFENLGEAAVPSLGGLSESELIDLVKNYFDVNLSTGDIDKKIDLLMDGLSDLMLNRGDVFFFVSVKKSVEEATINSNMSTDRYTDFLLDIIRAVREDD